ncbi:pseudouridine synthase [uncultured Aquabacterium sp.]|jgi:23S rRNA pseudouridine2604 synthase|uniref:pseudouridine synthase n=1 Tax=uncultured Aquabacterium sp. TaxID=158753 RepID=UPI00344DEDD8
MTERKKLSLNRPAPTEGGDAPSHRKPPVRGSGTAPRKRMTAAEAAQAREEAAARAAAAPTQRRHPDDRTERPPRRDASGRDDRRPPPRREDDRRPAPQRADDRRAAPYGEPRHPRDRDEAGYRSDRSNLANRRDPGDRSDRTPRAAPRPAQPPHTERPTPDDGRMRLSKLMSERGLASRREADEWIEQGWVRVNGEVVDELGTRVLPDVEVTIDPLARTQQAERVTILLHKPIGYVSGQAEDGHEPAVTLIRPENRWKDDRQPLQLTRGHLRHLAPAGRLDIDSTGLLVLTQDGRIARQLIGEDSGVEKEYLVRVQAVDAPDAENVSAVVPPEVIEQLRFGLELDGRQLKPAQVSWQNEQQLRFVLREGRKRQIRRMCELVGLRVVGLKRVRMGRITLGKLPVGEWRFLRADERF